MSETIKRILRDAVIHYIKAGVFAVVIYLLLIAIYGGIRISFLWLSVAVVFAFTVAYVPHLIQIIRVGENGASGSNGTSGASGSDPPS